MSDYETVVGEVELSGGGKVRVYEYSDRPDQFILAFIPPGGRCCFRATVNKTGFRISSETNLAQMFKPALTEAS